MKRKLRLIFTILFAVTCALGIFVACGKEEEKVKPVAGAEVGEYYCDVNGKECTLTLTDECKFTLALGGEPVSGDYVPNGESLTIKYGTEEISATYFNDVVSFTFHSTSYKFLRKIEYTITFDTDGGSAVAPLPVINGKKAERPANPSKEGKVFVGWYTDSAFKSPYRFNEPVTSDLKLYARFVEPIEPEFTVSFNVNGGEGSFDPVKTAGHVVYDYDLPTPEWEGHEFVGWWVSHYESAEKLTYRYDGQPFSENTTLFAVWKGDAPALSVEEKLISWTSAGMNNQYTLVVKNATTGEEVHRTTSGQTAASFDFAQQAEGDYVVTVTVNNKTATAYYRNKGLAKVSVFRVEESTLLFNAVENATEYLLSIECGIEGHHPEPVVIPADGELSYDFSECDMKDGKIVFTVTARAEGYVSSVSDPYSVTRELDKAAGFTVEKSTETLSWTAVPNATSYDVTVKHGSTSVYSGNVSDGTSIPLKYYEKGELVITVTPKARGWNSPAASSYNYEKETIATPSGLHIDVAASQIVWDEVVGASSYEVIFGGKVIATVNEGKYTFTEEILGTSGIDCSVTVRAIAADPKENSIATDECSFRNGKLGTELRYRDGVLSWDPVLGVKNFYLSVNGGNEAQYGNVASIPVTFTESGVYAYTLRAVYADETKQDDTLSVTVKVYELSFDAQGSEDALPSLFVATGDRVKLPSADEATLYGYDLNGWYTDPDAGDLYSDSVFLEENDRTLYAHWDPKQFHVTLVVGAYGEDTDEIANGVTAFYRCRVELPIPTSNDPTKSFSGWYDSATGEVAFTNADGIVTSYNYANDMTLYAQWVDVLAFTPVYDGKGCVVAYQVSKSPDIGLSNVKELTIPETYHDIPVTQVIDFTDCGNLEVVRIPDSIQFISVATTESAFTDCDNLRAIEIYQTNYNGDKYYSDDNGVLLYNNPVTGKRELKLYPTARDADTYNIPDGVQTVASGAIRDVKALKSLTFPASVTLIETKFITGWSDTYGSPELTTVAFEVAANGAAEEPLVIQPDAFHYVDNLTTLILPARLASLNFYEMFTFSSTSSPSENLTSISIVGTGGEYSSEDGAIIKNNGTAGKELVLYPLGKDTFTVPANVTAIGDSAVANNTKITSITIPGSITRIGKHAFDHCSSVTEIVFEGKENDFGLTIDDYAFYDCGTYNAPEAIVLPENLVKLGAYAFGDISTIKTVTINFGGVAESVEISETAFRSESSGSVYVETLIIGPKVKDINFVSVFGYDVDDLQVDPDNENYETDEAGRLYTKGKKELVWFKKIEGDFVLPDTVERIAASTFRGMYNMTSITIPASVTYIGAMAFYSCSALTQVTFKEPANGAARAPLTIGDHAFQSCGHLTEITLPEGLLSLGVGVFDYCNDLATVHFPSTLQTILTDPGTESAPPSFGLFGYTSPSTKLAELTMPETNTSFRVIDNVIYRLAQDPSGNYYESELLYGAPRSKTTSITVPASVGYIWNRAFYASNNFSAIDSPSLAKVAFSADKVTDKTVDGQVVAGTLVIGEEAFSGCLNLTSVTLPHGTTKISASAFSSSGLYDITIPNTVNSIEGEAFYDCDNLRTVTFEEGNPDNALRFEDGDYSVSYGVFGACAVLKSIILPERTSYIGTYAFDSCPVESIKIPASVIELADSSFRTSKIKSIEFAAGSKLQKIGDGAFSDSALESITIPASVVSIGDWVFQYCDALTTFIVEDDSQLLRLGTSSGRGDVFYQCKLLSTVDFGKNSRLQLISNECFSSCPALESIVLPYSLEELGEEAFSDSGIITAKFEDAEEGALSKLHIFNNAFAGTGLTSFVFPETENETILYEGSFLNCTALESVHISSKILNLKNAFLGCTAIREITVHPDNPSYAIDENNTYLKSKMGGDIIIVFGKVSGVLEIPAGSAQIGASAFIGAEITEVHIPRSVMRIGDSAFKDCALLEKVIFETGSALNTIGKEAFSGCVSLNDIDFRKTPQLNTFVRSQVSSSSNYGVSNTFANCTSLTEIDLSGTRLTVLPPNTFAGCTALETLRLPRTLTTIETRTGYSSYVDTVLGHTKISSIDLSATNLTEIPQNFFKGSASLETVHFPNRVASIGASAFANCSQLTTVDLTGNGALTEIGNEAFKGCEALTTVKLSTAVKTLRYACFADCTSLNNVDMNSLESVEYMVFYNTGFTKLTLPVGVLEWGGGEEKDYYGDMTAVRPSAKNAIFGACTKLKEVVFPANMNADTILAKYMFDGCTALDTLTFAPGCPIKKLASYLFENCSALEEVVLPASIEDLSSYDFASYLFSGCPLRTLDMSACAATQLYTSLLGSSYSAPYKTTLETVKLPAGLTAVPSSFFSDCVNLTEIEIPAGVTTLEGSVFDGCTNLTTVKILGSLTSLGSYVFQDCTSLEAITLPDTVTKMGDKCFAGCKALTTFKIPSGINDSASSYSSALGDSLFLDCVALTSVDFTGVTNVKTLSSSMFKGCTLLSTLTLPASLTKIGSSCFENSGITQITIPQGVIAIGNKAFAGSKLASITFNCGDFKYDTSSYASTPPSDLFKGCTELTTVKLPDKLIAIGTSWFSGCTALEGIELPESVTSIAEKAFENCTKLSEIDVSHVASIGQGAFDGCDKLLEDADSWKDGVFYLGTLVLKADNDKLKAVNGAVTLKEGTVGIAPKAFLDMTELKSIVFPESLTSIGANAFEGCTGLASVDFTKVTKLTTIEGSTFKGCSALSSVTIPASVTSLGSSCFEGTGLTEITIPDTVTSVNSSVFKDCKQLITVTIRGNAGTDSTPAKGISRVNSSMFENCEKLATVSLHDGITQIDTNAFRSCSALAAIDLPAGITTIYSYAFKDCKLLASVKIPEKLASVSSNVFEGCVALTKVDFSEAKSLRTISDSAFKGCTLLADVSLPDTVSSIGSSAFEGTALKNIVIPAAVSTIGNGAFKDCKQLATVTLPAALSDYKESYYSSSGFGTGVFEGCENLTAVDFKGCTSLTAISNSTFKGCTALTEIDFTGTKITKLGDSVFEGCTALRKVTVPDQVTSLGSTLFKGCTALREFTFPELSSFSSYSSKNLFEGCTLDLVVLPKKTLSSYDGNFAEVVSIKKFTFKEGCTEVNSDMASTIAAVTGLQEIVFPKSITKISGEGFAKLPATVKLCFVAENEEAVKSTYGGGEIAWEEFKAALPAGAQITYGYKLESTGENAAN